MRYNMGDKVKIKTWDEMEREFGLDMCGNIACKLTFTKEMLTYAGEIVTISGVGDIWYHIEEDNGGYAWSDDMISYKIVETSSLYNNKVTYIPDDFEPVIGAYEHYFDFDPVDKPSHYADKEIEVIDYIQDTLSEEEFEGYCMGNVIKYVSRYKHKNGVEDLKKARYYLNKVIDEYESEVE